MDNCENIMLGERIVTKDHIFYLIYFLGGYQMIFLFWMLMYEENCFNQRSKKRQIQILEGTFSYIFSLTEFSVSKEWLFQSDNFKKNISVYILWSVTKENIQINGKSTITMGYSAK